MKITFIFPRQQAYNSATVRELPSGGTEKATIYLGEALQQLGYEVNWITTIEETRQPLPDTDVVIAQEAAFFEDLPSKILKVWWCHHFIDQPIIRRNAPYYRMFGDKCVTLSQCQHDEFENDLKIKSSIIGHGIWPDEICTTEEKDPYRLIYASTPFRGLERIPDLFPAIKAAEPRATLAVASSMGTYGNPEQDDQYRSILDNVANLDGVEMLGALNQEQLYKEYAKASIFFYPCTWRETYCLAMDEAIAHGCEPVTTDIGALPERNFHGAMPERILYNGIERAFLWADQKPYKKTSHMWKQPQSWDAIAERWDKEVLSG